MQINNNNSFNLNLISQSYSSSVANTTNNSNNKVEDQNTDTIPTQSTDSPFAYMSLDEIKSYLQENRIEDDVGSRAKALFDMKKFVNRLEPNTYNRMIDLVINEKDSSRASMRHASFPSTKILDENPRMFHAILETTLSMDDPIHAVIFNLDLKQDFSNYSKQIGMQNEDESDIDFSHLNLLEFLLKKLEEIEDDSKNGRQINQRVLDDYRMLFENYNNYEEDSSTRINSYV